MMRGNWFGSGYCPVLGGYGTFSFWHILVMLGALTVIVGLFLMAKKNRKSNDSLELLKMHFVEGKITEEEYIKRKNVLERK